VLWVLTLLFHDGSRRIELPEHLYSLLLIDNAIATDIDDLEHSFMILNAGKGSLAMANPVKQLAELSECDAANTAHIERTESILWGQKVVV
jgi:hypothetical protein